MKTFTVRPAPEQGESRVYWRCSGTVASLPADVETPFNAPTIL
ncbi:MAG: hypothetical protein ABIR47_06885 [Candidatus Kapaibacterium sp.]